MVALWTVCLCFSMCHWMILRTKQEYLGPKALMRKLQAGAENTGPLW